MCGAEDLFTITNIGSRLKRRGKREEGGNGDVGIEAYYTS
jgi:hypothetical protein